MKTPSVGRTAWGFVLVIVGLILIPTPIVAGWPFVIPGLLILSERFPWVKKWVDWAKEKAKSSKWQ